MLRLQCNYHTSRRDDGVLLTLQVCQLCLNSQPVVGLGSNLPASYQASNTAAVLHLYRWSPPASQKLLSACQPNRQRLLVGKGIPAVSSRLELVIMT